MADVKEDRAKVFWSGRSQAVRIPKAYRFDTDEVTIRKDGSAVIMEPVEADDEERRQREWDRIFAEMDSLGPFDDDMVEAALNRPGPDEYDRLNCDLKLKD